MTLKQLKEELRYSPRTGQWVWLVTKGRKCKAGQKAGWTHHSGYICITFHGRTYLAHRLAFFYMTGRWPKQELDHRNNVSNDNRWKNLREATRPENTRNQRRQFRSASQVKGVSIRKEFPQYRARIHLFGKSKHLGYFDCPKKAHAAYRKAAKERFGEFARAM